MRVIDILNKIANGEKIPLKIKVKGYKYRKLNGQFWSDETEMYLIDNCNSIYNLNDEVEIIEEDKKIYKVNEIKPSQEYCYNNNTQKEVNEKIRERLYDHECYMKDLAKSINEIIDYLNNKENK